MILSVSGWLTNISIMHLWAWFTVLDLVYCWALSEKTILPLAQFWPIQFIPYSLSQIVFDLESNFVECINKY